MSVHSASGDCPAIDQGFDLGRVDPLAVGSGFYGFEIFYRCAEPRRLVLRNSALFERTPGHVDFARIQLRGHTVEQLFTVRQQQLALPDAGQVAAVSPATFVRLGLTHIVGSVDRWVMVLAALLLVRRRRDLAYLVLALFSGYLLSWMLSVSGLVLPRMQLMEAFVGLLVALLGATLIQRETSSPRIAAVAWPVLLLLLAPVTALLHAPWAALALLGAAAAAAGFFRFTGDKGGRDAWLYLVATFAFLDGFVLPSVLGPAQLPRAAQAGMVMGFDLGAVLAATVLMGLAIGVWALSRAGSWPPLRALVNDVGAAGLSGLGAYWLLSRLWAVA